MNYLAAGSCNFNDGGVSIWPFAQITHDTQYYIRDAVIDYIKEKDADNITISPAIEGRLNFTDVQPTTTSTSIEPSTTTTSAEPTTTTTSAKPTTTTTSIELTTTTTSVITTSTTTTVPGSTCTLKVIPKKLHKLLGAVEPVKVFILVADKNSAFSTGAQPDWGNDAIKTMFAVPLGKRIIIAVVLVQSGALEAGDSTVAVDSCSGTIQVQSF